MGSRNPAISYSIKRKRSKPLSDSLNPQMKCSGDVLIYRWPMGCSTARQSCCSGKEARYKGEGYLEMLFPL
eukprot:scaffold36845_cov168-Amphora_coffeaeformis.AAC.3